MKSEKPKDQTDYSKPVAYDTEGRPLYYHPPVENEAPKPQHNQMIHSKPDGYEGQNFDPKIRTQYANEPELTHATRAYEPEVPEVGEKLRKKHEESVRLYPFLNLSEGEFVMLRIRRHPIGLLIPVLITVLTVTILSVIMFLVPDFYASSQSQSSISLPAPEIVIGVLLLLILLSVIVGGIAVWIYIKNQFFLTNESVIQEIQHSLFSHHEQTVSLGSVEDASYKQQGILQYIFNYGTMRLSTEGEETTYRFAFVENPKEQIATVTDAVESFKNGRPVGTEFLDS